MKRAGAKNDGAWFRSNKVITGLVGAQQVALATLIAQLDETDGAYNALTALAAETGVDLGVNFPTTANLWCSRLVSQGIPRQIWYGKLTFTTYHRTGNPGNYKYAPNYNQDIFPFSKKLRKTVRNFIFALRETNDVFDVGNKTQNNPGGLPDANRDT